jgi:hypothetical protein
MSGSKTIGGSVDRPTIPITYQALESYGFGKWNNLFEYRCFPPPLGGNYRIEPVGEDLIYWRIYLTDGRMDWRLRIVESMEGVFEFYKGICGKNLNNKL